MFFVYGVSMTLAKNQAAKKCSTSVGAHPKRRQLSPDEYQAKLNDMAQHLFETMKPQRLSHSLSTPALCQQYIVLAMTQEAHRDVHIRYHKLSDKVNPKTKKPIINLVVFNGEAAA